MIALGWFAAGALASVAAWVGLRGTFREAPALRRTNYRGASVPVAAGVVLVAAVVLVATIDSIWASVVDDGVSELRRAGDLLLVASLGFAMLGLFDDLVGATEVKGFRGHLGALRQGRITSGLLKLLGGLALGVLCVPGDLLSSIRGGLLIAATANLANLFDRAPGRVIKVGILGAAIVGAVGGLGWTVAPTMLVVGAGAGLLWADLREQCMLGDTGSNVLGAAIGYGLVAGLSGTGEWAALAVVVAANLVSERVSFSAVIDRTGPLRWLDRLGCGPERRGT